MAQLSVEGAALIYYDGTISGSAVTNLGSLGSSGNGVIMTATATPAQGGAVGSVTSVATGGPEGTGDAYLNLSSSSFAGGWVDVPAASLPNFRNSSWSMSGFFTRSSNSNAVDFIVHVGSGDGYGGENEIYLYANAGNNNVRLEAYPSTAGTSAQSLALNTWHSYAITFTASGLNDGLGTLRLYLNGNLAGTLNNLDTNAGPALSQILRLGGIGYAANPETANRGYTGGLDDFAFYDFVLSNVDVTALHNGSVTPLTVPEPSRGILVLLACLGLLWRRARS